MRWVPWPRRSRAGDGLEIAVGVLGGLQLVGQIAAAVSADPLSC